MQDRHLILYQRIAACRRHRAMEKLVHSHQPAEITVTDRMGMAVESRAHRRHLFRRRAHLAKRGAIAFEQHAGLENLLQFAKSEIGNARADARLALDESLQ